MFIKTMTEKSTKDYWASIKEIKSLLSSSDYVLLGVGSGLSASGGLNYTDSALVQKWFPEYYAMGFKSLVEIQSVYWWFQNSNPLRYWGYWAKHIYHIRYESGVLEPYKNLKKLLDDKNHFICSTNADGQLTKSGIPREKIFAPQGDYCYFQCAKPCCDEVFYNEDMVRQMVENMPNPLEIRKEDIPTCPNCGGSLIPNLRCDNSFVEKLHIQNIGDYEAFTKKASKGKTLLLELGVGYNTPGIIRYPFEQMTKSFKNVKLVRINLNLPDVPKNIADKSLCVQADINKVLQTLLNQNPFNN